MRLTTLNNNHVITTLANTSTLFSYDTEIAMVYTAKGKQCISLTTYWDYSATTLKWLKKFLGTNDTKAQIQAKLDNGLYLTHCIGE